MFHIKKQQQSAFHFANNPQQSINAFPSSSHTSIATGVTNSGQNWVSSTSFILSSSSFIIAPTQSTTSSLSAERSGSKLTAGAIAGIAVGGVCLLIGLLFISLLFFLRRRNAKKNRLSIANTMEKSTATTMQNEKLYSETNSPTPLVHHQYFVNQNGDEDNVFWNGPPIGTFHVVSTYTQTLDDELYIQPGDKVQIYTEYDDGWCLGINMTRGGSRGVFPLYCINIERPL